MGDKGASPSKPWENVGNVGAFAYFLTLPPTAVLVTLLKVMAYINIISCRIESVAWEYIVSTT